MREQDRVVLCRVQFPVCLVGEFGVGERGSHLELEVAEVKVFMLSVNRFCVIIRVDHADHLRGGAAW